MMTIHEMRVLRIDLGYTYEMLSKKSGVPAATVQKVFSGTSKAPRQLTLVRLEKALREAAAGSLREEPTVGLPAEQTSGQGDDRENTISYRPIKEEDFYKSATLVREAAAEEYSLGKIAEEEEKARKLSGIRFVPADTHTYVLEQGEYTLEDYLSIPDDHRVELIDGVFYDMAAPSLTHQYIGGMIFHQLQSYVGEKGGPCLPFMSPVDVQLDSDDRTVAEPDVIIVCDPKKFRHNRVFGAPDFVVEVLAPTTRTKDRIVKLRKYQAAGVREYWMVDLKGDLIEVVAFKEKEAVKYYHFDEQIPVNIYGGDCIIDFRPIKDRLELLKDPEKEGEYF